MKQFLLWRHAVVLTVAVILPGCDRVRKLAEDDDAKDATAASADSIGLPQACLDYLEVLECASAKSDPASAKTQTDAARTGFKSLATSGGPAAAKKQCEDLMAGSQAGFAQLGCTKGAAAAAAKTVQPTAPPTAAKPTAAVKPTAAATTPTATHAASAAPAAKAAGTLASATTAGRGRCPKGTLRAKGAGCDVPTCKTDDDCSTHACSLVRDGVRACSGSIDLIDDSEFQ